MSWTHLWQRFRRRKVWTRTYYQAQTTECPVAALGMILDYFGRHVPMEELRHATGVSRDCVNAADVLRAARQYGLSGKAVRAEIEDLPRLGFPLIAHVRFIHFVVVEDIAAGRVFFNDPACGKHDRSLDEFHEKFTGVVLKFEPTAEFQRGGRPMAVLGTLGRKLAIGKTLVAALLATGLLLAVPTLLAAGLLLQLVDQVLPTARVGPGLAALALLAGALTWGREAALARLERMLATTHTEALLRHMLRLPFTFFTYRLPGNLQALVLGSRNLASVVTGRWARAVSGALGLPLLVGALLWVDVPLTLAVLALAALQFGLLRLLQRARARRSVQTAYRANWQQAVLTFESMAGSRTGGRDHEFLADVCGGHANAVSVQQEFGELQALESVLPRACETIALFTVLSGGALAVMDGRLSVGAVLAVQWLTVALLAGVRALAAEEGEREQIEEIINTVEEIPGIAAEALPTQESEARLEGALTLEGVVFGYARFQRPLLQGVSLVVRPGMQLGITGPSGGGKSTLAGLMVGLHRPWSGRVTLAGQPLEALPRAVVARSVAWVSKIPLLFEGTLRENLMLWDPAISDEALHEAVRDACLDEVVAERGLEAPVLSRGLNFSAGQRQRLEIARALARRPALLILDEALDALQPSLEQQLRANLRRRGCTLVVITHRASTLRGCDERIVIERGQIVAPGCTTWSDGDGHGVAVESPFHDVMLAAPAAPPDAAEGAPLAAALRLVAAAAGIRGTLPEGPPAPGGHAGVLPLARRARLWARRVRLVLGDWWQRDNGPLLGFLEEGQQPVALLPRPGRPYLLVDPITGSRQEMTPALAARVDRHAYCLYERVAERIERPWQLLLAGAAQVRGDLATFLFAGLAAAALAAAGPLAALALLGGGAVRVWPIAGALGVLALAGLLFDLTRALALMRGEARVDHHSTAAFWERLLRLPVAFFRRQRPEMLARCTGSVAGLRERLGSAPLRGVLAAGAIVSSLAVIVWLRLPLAGVALGLLLPRLLLAAWIARRALPLQKEQLDHSVASHMFLFDLLRGIARLRSLDSERRVAERWLAGFRATLVLDGRLRRLQAPLLVFGETYFLLALGILVLALGDVAALGVAGFFALQLAFVQALLATGELAGAVAAVIESRLTRDQLDTVYQVPLESSAGKQDPGRLRGAIELHGVGFQYETAEAPVLEDISLNVAPGELVALVGPSGGGKSTLFRVLLGFEAPRQGTVCYDGVPLAKLDAAEVRAQVGAVLQEDQLNVGTLRGNIAGSSPYGLAEVWEACRIAVIDRDIRRLPMGIQTILEDSRFSSGQKQRVLLAAAVLRQPRLLLLDEATSALDEALEREVMANLRALGVSCLIATHRASTVAHVDRVYVLEGGRIIESGRPAELLARDSALARLHAQQRANEREGLDESELM